MYLLHLGNTDYSVLPLYKDCRTTSTETIGLYFKSYDLLHLCCEISLPFSEARMTKRRSRFTTGPKPPTQFHIFAD